MSPFDLFDFSAWLERKDPGHRWQIEPVEGGLVNVVVRATHTSQGSSSGAKSAFAPRETLILKYAPPFVAALGPAVPFSEFRQVIESRALELLGTKFTPPGNVRFSRLLEFDKDAHVLVLEDLGTDMVTLDRWLATHPAEDVAKALGTELGTFFAHLHTTAELADDPRSFESPDSQKMISSQIVESIQEHLSQWGVEDAIELAAVIREAYVSLSVPQDRLVFQVGDLWPGSVMVSNDGKRSAVIDWEFAGPGRPLGGMAQLAAHLRIQLLAAPEASPLADRIATFARALFASYREGAETRRAGWLNEDVRDEVVRLAWILHGREIINNACEIEQYDVRLNVTDKAVRRKMVETGAWYVRACGSGEVDRQALEAETFLRPLYRG